MIYEQLSEAECYLYALTQDESGLDLAEFCYIDETSDDGCFRAWPFQVAWFRTNRQKTIEAAARSIGKSLSIRLRAFAFPFIHPGDEMVVTAPEAIHLEAVTDNIEILYTRNRLAQEMLAGPIKHRQFRMNFKNGARLMGRIPHRDGSGIKGCFKAGTLVLTKRGHVPIEDVIVGDEVLTHNNRWRPVTHTWKFWEKSVYHIKANRLAEGLTCSGIQKFFARYGNTLYMDNNIPEWIEAPKLGEQESRRHRWNLQSPALIPSSEQPIFPFKFNEDNLQGLYYLFGLYQAEGSTSLKSGQVTLSIHEKEVEHVYDLVRSVGFNPGFSKKRDTLGRDIYFSSKPLILFLQEHFGSKKEKRIPIWVLGAPRELRQAFFNGAIFGDGHQTTEARNEYVTCIRSLAYDMKLLAQSLGYLASVKYNSTITTFSKNGWYTVSCTSGQSSNFRDGMVMAGVQSSIETFESMYVYDLTVEEDHSFLADTIVVSNTHPIWLSHDEAQDYGEAGWTEITSTVKEKPESRWMAHGVTRGLGDSFDKKISGADPTWHVKKIPAMYRPTWTPETRQQAIDEYGGYDSSGYRRNILGLSSNDNSPIFVLHRIMSCVESDSNHEFNTTEYYYKEIDEATVREHESILDLIRIPANHKNYRNFWIGMDLGWTTAPTSIVVFAEIKEPKKEKTSLKLLTRLILKKISPEDQVKVIMDLMETYHPLSYALDATGAGFPLVDNLRAKVKENPDLAYMLNRIKPFNFSEKVIVGFDPAVEIKPHDPDGYLAAAIKRPFVEASTDALRLLIDGERMALPYDMELIGELQAAPQITRSGSSLDQYGRSGRKSGMHNLDAMRLAAFAYESNFIDEMIANHQKIWTPPAMIIY